MAVFRKSDGDARKLARKQMAVVIGQDDKNADSCPEVHATVAAAPKNKSQTANI
jgi:hypothetical protein